MFYFLLPALISYNFILVAAAVIPAVFLMLRVYKSDRLEKESGAMLWGLVKAGVFSSLIALVEERVSVFILDGFLDETQTAYQVILYFVIVAAAEESSKYLFLKHRTWKSLEFDCQYDGVVYAVFVSLGFALWENISYVMTYGFNTAIIRALTAIPGHACFGVFMGVFYGIAKKYDNRGQAAASKLFRVLSLAVPMLLHGTYDYIASMDASSVYFVAFIVVLFLVSYVLVGRTSKNDRYI